MKRVTRKTPKKNTKELELFTKRLNRVNQEVIKSVELMNEILVDLGRVK